VPGDGGLAAADYSKARRHCDVVMKGGITSGVVYPLAVCELAQDYRFKCVGGTSAGAIAAAATAAAEYGRDKHGFRRLARLPDELGHAGRLRGLFQPERSTRRPFAALIGKLEGGVWGAIRAAWFGSFFLALLGALPGIALILLSILYWSGQGWGVLGVAACVLGVATGLAVALLGAAGAVVVRLCHVLARHVPDNGFGLCSGMRPDNSGRPGLTPWLTDLLEECAGRASRDPLTFGDLWAGPGPDADPRNPPPEGKRFVELEMMTTNLVNRLAKRIPWEEGGWYFDPDEFRRLFPEDVVRWMEANPPALRPERTGRRSELHRAQMRPRLPLPDPQDLPVVVAARMSLSFPLLLSAVPLWSFDHGRPQTAAREKAWQAWLDDRPDDWQAQCGPPQDWPWDDLPATPEAERCWFSDGGISSNFPIHFFDRLVPGRPTFGIDLRPFPFEIAPDPEDQANNARMAHDNGDGYQRWWYRFPVRPRRALIRDTRLPAFLGAAVKTMQNRVDEAQMRAPGYRDRVAHVEMGKEEGGMNLNMDRELIENLSLRGREAAGLLRRAYTAEYDSGRIISWDNHRWVRLRSALAALEQMHVEFAEGVRGEGDGVEGGRTYQELVWRPEDDAPTGYKLRSDVRRRRAEYELERIRDLGTGPDREAMMRGAPKPTPRGRIVPKE
jgi:predicted acylesterase/phospholipase RssA